MENKGGRPTKYTPELLGLCYQYLTNLPEDEVIHSIEGLADFILISRETIYQWAKDEDKGEFSDIVSNILSKQGKTLVNKGLKNEINPTITKLMLSKHGYSDKIEQQTDITSGGDKIKFTWENDNNNNPV
jgi:hypothetical protein